MRRLRFKRLARTGRGGVRRRWLLAAAAVLVVLAGGGYALSAGSSGASAPAPVADKATNIPLPVIRDAATYGISGLAPMGQTTPRGLGWFSGTSPSGEAVVALGSPMDVSPFVPLAGLRTHAELTVESRDGGASVMSVDWRDIAGVVAVDVASVEVVLQDGTTRSVPIVDGAFVYSASGSDAFPVEVNAHNANGAVLATETLPAPSALGSGCPPSKPLCNEVGDPGQPAE